MNTVIRAAIAISGVALAGPALSQDGANFPTEPVEIIVTAPAGGVTDTGTRLLAKAVEGHFDQPWVILNRPGAGGLIGMQALASASNDCYTAGYMLMPHFPAQALTGITDLTIEDFELIALLVDDPGVIAVANDSEYETFDDLLEATRANPGQISWGDNGYLGDDHLVIAGIMAATGIEPNIINYDGSSDVNPALLGGHIAAKAGNVGDTLRLHQDGQMRILAVSSEERLESMPDVPTLTELGYDVVASTGRGLAYPAGTPKACVDAMAEVITTASKEQDYIDAMAEQGLTIRVLTGDDYKNFVDRRFEFVQGVLDYIGE